MKRQLHLNLFIHSRGHHEASWRHPASSPLALTDIRYYQDLAFPEPSSVEAARSRTEVILSLVRREKPTLRQLLASLAGARGHFTAAGTPEQIADLIEDWFTDAAADGFNIMPPLLPAMLDAFSAEVIPLLQRRGLFRTAYAGATLREHYGLAWPKKRLRGGHVPGDVAGRRKPRVCSTSGPTVQRSWRIFGGSCRTG